MRCCVYFYLLRLQLDTVIKLVDTEWQLIKRLRIGNHGVIRVVEVCLDIPRLFELLTFFVDVNYLHLGIGVVLLELHYFGCVLGIVFLSSFRERSKVIAGSKRIHLEAMAVVLIRRVSCFSDYEITWPAAVVVLLGEVAISLNIRISSLDADMPVGSWPLLKLPKTEAVTLVNHDIIIVLYILLVNYVNFVLSFVFVLLNCF